MIEEITFCMTKSCELNMGKLIFYLLRSIAHYFDSNGENGSFRGVAGSAC